MHAAIKIGLVFLLFTSLFFLTACDELNTISDIRSVEIDTEPLQNSFEAGTFDPSVLELIVTKENGVVRRISVNETMISESDQSLLTTAGTHSIIINYEGFSTEIEVTIHASDLSSTLLLIYQLGLDADLIDMSYEEWVESIRGEDGITPHIGENGHWFIGNTDTDISAHGQSAYDIYVEYHPDYEGDEQQWLTDLINGSLSNGERYDIVFDSMGGSPVERIEDARHGSPVDLPMPSKIGYVFSGWYVGQSVNDDRFHNHTPVTSDLELFARWETATHTVTFIDHDDTVLFSQNIRHGASASAPEVPYREGYAFTGWSETFTTVTDDLEIRALYDQNLYLITFDTGDGPQLDPIETPFGVALNLPVPEKEDAVFMGWTLNGTIIADSFVYDRHEDMTLVALWADGLSFETAIPLTVDDTIDFHFTQRNPYMYVTFTVEQTGHHFMGSFGEVDMKGYFYDDDHVLIDSNDDLLDLNFAMSCWLEEGKTYYLKARLYSEHDEGESTLTVSKSPYDEPTMLDDAWEQGEQFFWDLWTDLIDEYEKNPIIHVVVQNEWFKLLVIDHELIAFENLDENSQALPDLMSHDDYRRIDGTDIYALSLISMDLILADDITVVDDVYYSGDMNTLIRYAREDDTFIVPETVSEIASFAFIESESLEWVHIPINVVELGIDAFVMNSDDLILLTEWASKPETWSEDAYDDDLWVIWDVTDVTPVSYTFDAQGGTPIETQDVLILRDIETPMRDGHVFAGWFDQPELTGDPITLPYYSGIDMTLYAKWVERHEIEPDGLSFDSAFPIETSETATVTIANDGDEVYYVFVPEQTGKYAIGSTGEHDTYGSLYDAGRELLESDDDGGPGLEFLISYDLSAGETYYVKVRMYSSYRTGTFELRILLEEAYEESDLDMLWLSQQTVFNDVWRDLFTDSPQLTWITHEDYEFKTITMSDDIHLALEAEEGEFAALTDYIDTHQNDDDVTWVRIPDTNIMASDLLSIDLILQAMTRETDDVTYSEDMDRLIRYRSMADTFVIPEEVATIGNFAFYNCSWLEYLYLPISVDMVQGYAFDTSNADLIVLAEHDEQPSKWHEHAFDEDALVLWSAATLEPVTYTFDTNGGSEIDSRDEIVLMSVDAPVREGYDFIGWYDNPDLAGSPVGFPFYSDTDTIFYAGWLDRSVNGDSFDTAIPIEAFEVAATLIADEGDEVYYVFTPETSGEHTIASSGDYDTYGYLYDSDRELMSSNDDGGVGLDFLISHDLIAGETYYIKVRMYSSTRTGQFDVSIHVEYPYVSSVDSEQARIEVIDGVLPTVVTVRTDGGHGSGVIYRSEDLNNDSYRYYVLTNHHVVEEATEINIDFGSDGSSFSATDVYSYENYDMAVVRFETDRILEVHDSMAINDGRGLGFSIGQDVIAIGTPYDLDFFHYVTTGTLSLTGYAYSGVPNLGIMHNAEINPGNSGGPLFNLDGQLIGLNVAKVMTIQSGSDEFPAEGLNIALNINVLAPIISGLTEYDFVDIDPANLSSSAQQVHVFFNIFRPFDMKKTIPDFK